MRKTALILTALLIAGCDGQPSFQKQTWAYAEICVDGVVYLRSPQGSLTPKVNADFYPYTCSGGNTKSSDIPN